MKHAIIFDFDGTIADTFPVIEYAFRVVFKQFRNEDLTMAKLVQYFGPPEVGILEKVFLNHTDFPAILDCFYCAYEKKQKELATPDLSIINALQALKKMNGLFGIVTGKGRQTLDISMTCLLPGIKFDSIITGDDTRNPKPDPEGILMVLDELKIKPANSLFIGDSSADMDAALAAGVTPVLAQWYEQADPRVADTQNITIIHHVANLVPFVENWLNNSLGTGQTDKQ